MLRTPAPLNCALGHSSQVRTRLSNRSTSWASRLQSFSMPSGDNDDAFRSGECRASHCFDRRSRFVAVRRSAGTSEYESEQSLDAADECGLLAHQHYQYRTGLLDEDAYRGYEATIREQVAAFPGVRAMWQRVKHTYGTQFVTFLNMQIAKTPAHERSSMRRRWTGLLKANEQATSA